jgi:proline dehydrogenase
MGYYDVVAWGGRKLVLPLFSDKTIHRLGSAYSAGSSIEEGMHNVHRLFLDQRIMSTIDILGESSKTPEQADQYLHAYFEIIDRIASIPDIRWGPFYCQRPFSISLKPSAICVADESGDLVKFSEETPFLPRLEMILQRAQQTPYPIPVTVDMENHKYTEATHNAITQLRYKGYHHLGTVNQAMLDRSEEDLEGFSKELNPEFFDPKTFHLRECRGIYLEPKDIATSSIRKAKDRLLQRVEQGLKAGFYMEIATHDEKYVKAALEIIERLHVNKGSYEFQFLQGVPSADNLIIPFLLQQGISVRKYMPFELHPGDGTPYYRRRLGENPQLMFAWLREKTRIRRLR